MRKFLTTLVSAALLGLLPARAQEKVDFAKSIGPIFEASCLECHGPEKQKGKLRLDLKESALKQDDPDHVITRGDAGKSELYRRITLPADDDDRMPNKGKPLTKTQTDLIRDWINQGANWPDGLVVSSKAGDSLPEPGMRPAPGPSAAEIKALAELAASSVRVAPIAIDAGWREANLSLLGTNATDAALTPIGQVADLVRLNLAGTGVTDAGLVNLRGLTNLAQLHLERTRVTDAGLVNLHGLTDLTCLNLHSTAVTDAGLEQLYGLKNLRTIYLWETRTTEAGVKKLQAALPKLHISSSLSSNAPSL
jgi:hypothetical protein